MELFARFRREKVTEVVPVYPDRLPGINQRICVQTDGREPVPSRIDDEAPNGLVIALPSIPLEPGYPVELTWEEEDGWYRLTSVVVAVDDESTRPTAVVSRIGHLIRFADRRSELRSEVELPVDLHVMTARVLKPGHEFSCHTTEIGTAALRFATSSPLAPGDILEASVHMGSGEHIDARVKVIRIDTVSGSWRHVVTARFVQLLHSDETRIVHFLSSLDSSGVIHSA